MGEPSTDAASLVVTDKYRSVFEFGGVFEFSVTHDHLASGQSWTVALPHQCDAFEVVSFANDRETAATDLAAFIAEAQRVLAWLKAQVEDAGL